MTSTLRSLIDEPKVVDPPATNSLDAMLVVAVLIGLTLEAILRTDIVYKPFALVVFALLSFLLLIRRSHPLLALSLTFGAFFVLDVAGSVAGRGTVEVYSAVFVLFVVHALFRWGSGKHALIGVAVMAINHLQIQFTNFTGVGDLIGGALVLCFPAAIALIMRYRRSYRDENIERIKLHEREQLARDLHDTVAHHVSAIAIQAQAGQVLAGAANPEGATQALAVIEEEASRTLAEMRAIVRVLRNEDDDVAHAPQRGVADIASLSESARGHGPRIEVELSGDVTTLSPPLDAGIYRLAQESITNALRHAASATAIKVEVAADDKEVMVSVVDDGAATNSVPGRGWGIVGMTERAELLGGSLQAGPRSPRGWQVRAVLPRQPRSRANLNAQR